MCLWFSGEEGSPYQQSHTQARNSQPGFRTSPTLLAAPVLNVPYRLVSYKSRNIGGEDGRTTTFRLDTLIPTSLDVMPRRSKNMTIADKSSASACNKHGFIRYKYLVVKHHGLAAVIIIIM